MEHIVIEKLKPFVKRIDEEGYYAKEYLQALGREGYWLTDHTGHRTTSDVLRREAALVEETARSCMTTAFNIWCHLAVMTYLRYSRNEFLRREILPRLERGVCLGGTGLSNPMKYYAGLEKLHLQAERVDGGYIFRGQLSAISNLGADHYFGAIAALSDSKRVMALVDCKFKGIVLRERRQFIGLNGSATYFCQFDDVFIPDQWIISEQADDIVRQFRSPFVMYQIPLGFGVMAASVETIRQARNRQCGCNSYLPVQAEDIERKLAGLTARFHDLANAVDLSAQWKNVLRLRLDTVYATLEAVQAAMLHQGGPAYLQGSDASRRLREAYFLSNLTPTVRHLEKILRE